MWSEGKSLQNNKYSVVELIGHGGFGLTYLAKDNTLQRDVVIKTPNKIFQSSEAYASFIRRFQREGKALARVSHPNVVQVIELFQENGIPSLVLAYVQGDTMETYVQKHGLLSEAKLSELFHKLSNALQHLHSKGVIHCDIHPKNIMMRPDDEPILIDFGSSKNSILETSLATTTINNYFSPYEQGRGGPPQAGWDIYGLAATLYFAATGQNPQPAIDRKFYNADKESAQMTKTQISHSLGTAILLGMSVEPTQRPSSVEEWRQKTRNDRPSTTRVNTRNTKKYTRVPALDTYVWSGDVWRSLLILFVVYLSIGTVFGYSKFYHPRLLSENNTLPSILIDSLFFAFSFSVFSSVARMAKKRVKKTLAFAGYIAPTLLFIFTTILSCISLLTFFLSSTGSSALELAISAALFLLLVYSITWLRFAKGDSSTVVSDFNAAFPIPEPVHQRPNNWQDISIWGTGFTDYKEYIRERSSNNQAFAEGNPPISYASTPYDKFLSQLGSDEQASEERKIKAEFEYSANVGRIVRARNDAIAKSQDAEIIFRSNLVFSFIISYFLVRSIRVGIDNPIANGDFIAVSSTVVCIVILLAVWSLYNESEKHYHQRTKALIASAFSLAGLSTGSLLGLIVRTYLGGTYFGDLFLLGCIQLLSLFQ